MKRHENIKCESKMLIINVNQNVNHKIKKVIIT